jgi:hypothetical protein
MVSLTTISHKGNKWPATVNNYLPLIQNKLNYLMVYIIDSMTNTDQCH